MIRSICINSVETFFAIWDVKIMLESTETISWSIVARSYGRAERALGRLAHGLQVSPLHATWLWREITRSAVTIAQAGGYQAKLDQLRLALVGAPLERDDHSPGLAAATRTFLAAAPLFRSIGQADSNSALWPEFWRDDSQALSGDDALTDDGALDGDGRGEGAGGGEKERRESEQLMGLVRELAAFAEDGQRPALINLFIDLRKHAATRHLPPPLVRIALPLALTEAGLVPKAAPGLLGGRRLPLGLSRAVATEKPLNDWLKQGLEELMIEADRSHRRLMELTSQYRAWHEALMREGLRKHACAPKALDLLAATPVVSIGLVARHLGCSHVAAGRAVARLVDLGILIEQTARARHKIFIAGDLPIEAGDETMSDGKLSLSEPLRPVDHDALSVTLSGLFADIDRQAMLTERRLAEAKG